MAISNTNDKVQLFIMDDSSPTTNKDIKEYQIISNKKSVKEIKEVETITLYDLCIKNNIRGNIDILNINTEGSEHNIIKDDKFFKDLLRPKVLIINNNSYDNLINSDIISDLLFEYKYIKIGEDIGDSSI